MQMKLIETCYKAEKVLLPVSGVEVTGNVYVRDGKVYKTDTISCVKEITKDEKANFSFTLNQPYMPVESENWSDPKLSINNWPAGVSVNDTIEEYKVFVLKDIA